VQSSPTAITPRKLNLEAVIIPSLSEDFASEISTNLNMHPIAEEFKENSIGFKFKPYLLQLKAPSDTTNQQMSITYN
jgi:hypothetical protein